MDTTVYLQKKAGYAEYGGASWDNLVEQVSDISLEDAEKKALADPKISFFFYCNQFMALTPKDKPARNFKPRDAAFFSGAPWYGTAGQCDLYRKVIIEEIKNAAQYGEANWDNQIDELKNTNPDAAREHALANSLISYYFICREHVVLDQKDKSKPPRVFNPGDAVFFSGDAWLGEAGQCDTYRVIRLNEVPA